MNNYKEHDFLNLDDLYKNNKQTRDEKYKNKLLKYTTFALFGSFTFIFAYNRYNKYKSNNKIYYK